MANTKAKAPPIIDFAPFYGTDPTAREDLVAQVRAACLDKGFFQIINHSVPATLQDAMFTLAHEFFALPIEEKLKVDANLNDYHRGYETFRSQAFSGSLRPDFKESIDFGPDYQPDHRYVQAKHAACGPNLYPASVTNPAAFRTTVDTYLAAALGLANDVLRVLALGLGLQEGYFEGFATDPVATVKMLYYPSQEPVAGEGGDDGERGINAHTDFGFVTLLMQDDVGGLQVFDNDTDSWLDVTPIKHAYVVNLGDCTQRMTNDRYRSGLHQVINRSGRTRYSIACFHAGDPEYVVRCLPRGIGGEGGEEKYPPVSVNDYLTERTKDSYIRAEALNAT
ncbi:uncharacterized protein LAJ45_11131 [Morchella importuna]|uniref:uncharacterized protein n=1 Tax=Morchella importuna TaxID=1174673 RepID=UPI001E8E5520|nr:uncharacterized protein LAJ45_11131 [Morchella importuna]KAH8144861.1 hypothetical protein LAJ45_11131 [Morchella importuna]